MGIHVLIAGLGLITGFLSGLLGIGGGIVMAPLLLYVPPLLGLEPLPMRTVAGLTIVQGLMACITGAISHGRFHFVSGRLSLYMGTSIFVAALAGGVAWVSGFIPGLRDMVSPCGVKGELGWLTAGPNSPGPS